MNIGYTHEYTQYTQIHPKYSIIPSLILPKYSIILGIKVIKINFQILYLDRNPIEIVHAPLKKREFGKINYFNAS